VRTTAALTAGLSLAALGFCAFAIFAHRDRSDSLPPLVGVFLLASLLPSLFLWAAIRAWRGTPKGIESLSAIWGLVGICGFIPSVITLFAPHLSAIPYLLLFALITAVGVLLGALYDQHVKQSR